MKQNKIAFIKVTYVVLKIITETLEILSGSNESVGKNRPVSILLSTDGVAAVVAVREVSSLRHGLPLDWLAAPAE